MNRRRMLAMAVCGGLVASVAAASPSPVSGAPVTVTLCARAGSVTVPGGPPVTIWGFALGTCAAGAPATLPGPTIEITEGDVLTINLDVHASLGSQAVSILLAAADGVPDYVGVGAPGGTVSYVFAGLEPGVYLYESGVNARIQIPMGLYGTVIVNSADAGSAYGATTDTDFDVEALVVTSELDRNLNNSGNPAAFNVNDHAPEYFLINGRAYPNTVPVSALPGDRVLLRYANAGLQNHSMSLLGLHQEVIGRDSRPLEHRRDTYAELITAGQTMDAISDIPTSAQPGSRFAVYNRNGRLTNNLAPGGGMLMFINVVTPPLFLSFTGSGSASPAMFNDEDVVAHDPAGRVGPIGFSKALDLTPGYVAAAADVDALDRIGPNHYLMSFDIDGVAVPGVGTVDDADVVEFNAGTFSLLFDGSDVGLGAANATEDVDAMERLADGSFVMSTAGNPDVPGVTGEQDEDLLRFVPTSLGATTAGTWTMWFDGSDVSLGATSENVDGVALGTDGALLLSTTGAFIVPGVSGQNEDIFVCRSPVFGAASSCTFGPTLWFDGSARGVTGPSGDAANNVDGIG